MDPTDQDSLNQALESAYSNFNQNPIYSSANAVFSTAMVSFPATVSASLYCSGYGGISTGSLPTWLTPIPTAVVSIVLQEQAVYESIISSFIESIDSEAKSTSATSASKTSASATPATAIQSSPSSSSAGAPGSLGSLAGSVLAVAGLIFAGLYWNVLL